MSKEKPKHIKALGLKVIPSKFGVGMPAAIGEPLELSSDCDKRVYEINKFVGGYFDAVHVKVGKKYYVMYVNDEGAINGTNVGFLFDHAPYFGSAVFMSVDESKDCKLTLKQLSKHLHLFTTENKDRFNQLSKNLRLFTTDPENENK